MSLKQTELTHPSVAGALQRRMSLANWEYEYTNDDGDMVYRLDLTHIGFEQPLLARVSVDR